MFSRFTNKFIKSTDTNVGICKYWMYLILIILCYVIRIFNSFTMLGFTLDFQTIIFKIMSNHCRIIIYTSKYYLILINISTYRNKE